MDWILQHPEGLPPPTPHSRMKASITYSLFYSAVTGEKPSAGASGASGTMDVDDPLTPIVAMGFTREVSDSLLRGWSVVWR
jgi:hypothetical protein